MQQPKMQVNPTTEEVIKFLEASRLQSDDLEKPRPRNHPITCLLILKWAGQMETYCPWWTLHDQLYKVMTHNQIMHAQND